MCNSYKRTLLTAFIHCGHSKRHNKFLFPFSAKAIYGSFRRKKKRNFLCRYLIKIYKYFANVSRQLILHAISVLFCAASNKYTSTLPL